MSIETINKTEARLLGVLVEKAMTTPEHYPLTLNAAVNAANQKSNRHPVLALEEDEVLDALENLIEKNLAKRAFPGGSRVEKFAHTAGGKLGLNAACLAILAELMLRGPQTVGELRTRARRMAPIDSLDQAHELLQTLIENRFCIRLAPEPGSRAERFAQTLAPDAHPIDEPARAPSHTSTPVVASPDSPDLEARVTELERRLAALEQRLANS